MFFFLYFQTPTTAAEWKAISAEFYAKWNFPKCIGAIDGKHILLNPPANSGSFYFNYKESHSIILLALVRVNIEFIYADVGVNGRACDAAAWDISNLKAAIDRRK